MGNAVHVISTLVDSLRHRSPSSFPVCRDTDKESQSTGMKEKKKGQCSGIIQYSLDAVMLTGSVYSDITWNPTPVICWRASRALSKVLKHTLFSLSLCLSTHTFTHTHTDTQINQMQMNESTELPNVPSVERQSRSGVEITTPKEL